ncbi:hypothetical protein D3C79_1090710 [compost metagenome]
MLLEKEIHGVNESGDLLIVKKGLSCGDKEKLVYDKSTKKLFVTSAPLLDSDAIGVIGEIIEERFNG